MKHRWAPALVGALREYTWPTPNIAIVAAASFVVENGKPGVSRA
jgi:hypothetical protein